MLDNRHIVVGAGTIAASRGGRLLLLDSESASVWPLTSDNAEAAQPSVGPDGRILYVRQHVPWDLVETPVDGSAQRELLATDWVQSFGAWSRTADEFVFVTNRGGQYAVWISSADGSWQRKVVTSKDLGEAGEVGLGRYSYVWRRPCSPWTPLASRRPASRFLRDTKAARYHSAKAKQRQ